MDDTSTTTASADATTATTEAASTASTPSSESQATTTQPSTDAVAPATPTPSGAQAAQSSFATAQPRSAQTQTTTQPASPGSAQQDPADYKKRWEDTQTYLGRLTREHAELRKYKEQWGDLNPQQVREMVQRQQSDAQARQLKPWHPQHPEFARTEARLSQVRSYATARQAINADPNIDDASKGRLIGNLAQSYGITQDDAALYREHEHHIQDFQQRFARDPEASIGDIVERRVMAAIQQYHQYRETSTATDQWLNDPSRAKLLETHADDVLWAMDANTPRRDVGMTIAQLKSENEALKHRLGGQREVVETAAAQQAALKKRSTVVRDAVTTNSRATDPVEEGHKQGLTGSALLAHLRSQRSATAD